MVETTRNLQPDASMDSRSMLPRSQTESAADEGASARAAELRASVNWTGVRIALVGPLPPPAGGMANQTAQLAELLRGAGATVELIQSNAPYHPTWIGRLRGVRAIFRFLPYLASLWRAAHEADAFHIMANSGWAWHLFAVPAIWTAHLRGVPTVVNFRGGDAENFLKRSVWSVRPSLRAASVLSVPSGFLKDVFAGFGFNSCIVPNIVDTTRFFPAEERKRSQNAAAVILVPRNLELIYDIATAIRAFAGVLAALPNAQLVVAGSGPEEANLRSLAKALGVQTSVRFTGRLERDRMAEEYRRADVMLNPSLIDNMPNSVLEALASGTPVVSTNVGGVRLIVRDGETALLVPPGDPIKMADAVLRIVRNRDLAQRLRNAGLAEVRRYTWEGVRAEWEAVYATLLRTGAPRGR